MVKKKGIVSKLILGLLVLTAISFCFLGSTFARYTSGGTGTATTNVAKWDVSLAQAGSLTQTFDKLSPAMEAYTDTPRTHSTGKIKVAELSNMGDVDATVTFTTGDVEIDLLDGKGFGAGIATGNATEAEVKGLFSIKLWYSTETDSADSATTELTGATQIKLAAANGKVYVYAEVIWASDDENSADDDGAAADKLDTWVGENVESVAFDISYTAVQASEKPVDVGA